MNDTLLYVIVSSAVASITTLLFHIISMRVLRRQVIQGTQDGAAKVKEIMQQLLRLELQLYINYQYQTTGEPPTQEDLQADKEALDDYMEYRNSLKN
jgi:hypothetical protein